VTEGQQQLLATDFGVANTVRLLGARGLEAKKLRQKETSV
jgi:hypothetical protein